MCERRTCHKKYDEHSYCPYLKSDYFGAYDEDTCEPIKEHCCSLNGKRVHKINRQPIHCPFRPENADQPRKYIDTRKIEEKLGQKYHYCNLPPDLSKKYRQYFADQIPPFLRNGTSTPLCTENGTPLSSGYFRIVIGDYGAFVEIDEQDINLPLLVVAPGQEYRINDPKFSRHIKYEWYTINDGSNIKIYKQKRRVSYADYIPNKYYVSVHEVKPCIE